MSTIKTASLEELGALKDAGEIGSHGASPGDAHGDLDLPGDFWDDAEIRQPEAKQAVNLRIDPDIINFFKKGGRGYQTRMHAVLRSYVDAQKRHNSG